MTLGNSMFLILFKSQGLSKLNPKLLKEPIHYSQLIPIMKPQVLHRKSKLTIFSLLDEDCALYFVLDQEKMFLHKRVYTCRFPLMTKMNHKHLSLVCKHKHMLKNGAPLNKF